MISSNTIDTITKYYNLIGLDHEPTIEEKEFIRNFELELAKSMVNEFGESQLRKVANIILASIG